MRQLQILRADIESHESVDSAMSRLQELRILDEIPDTLILVQHPEVVTLGPKAERDGALKDPALSDYPTRVVDRGGGMTYHGPGQIVGYPILDLDNFFTDLSKYLRFLEETIILTLKGYGLTGERSPGETGVWLDVGKPNARKICALGVKTSRWVSMHGFALNVNTDLTYFENIIPCGINDKQVTSLEKEVGEKINIDLVKKELKSNIELVFDIKLL